MDRSLSPDEAPFRLEVVTDPGAIGDAWRALEAEAETVPFETHAWVATWIAAGALGPGVRPLILVGRRGDRLDLVLPLALDRVGPIRIARRLSGSHAGELRGLVRPGAAPDTASLAAALRALGRSEGVDAFVFEAVPAGLAPCLEGVGSARPSLDDAHAFRLDASFERLLAARNAGHKRKKLKQKEKILASAGDYRVTRAGTADEVEATLAAFFAQKGAALAARGSDDPFAASGVREAFRRMALAALGTDEPLLELTRLEAGGAIRAVIGASIRGGTLHALFASHAADDLARASPGETLFFRHIEAACGRGLAVYDMGQGRERYKESWCDETRRLVDVRLAVTALGRAAVALETAREVVKAAIRRDQRIWPLVRKWRARLAGRRAGAVESD